MIQTPRPPKPGKLIWPLAGLALGGLAANNPFYEPRLDVTGVITALFADVLIVLLLPAHGASSRIAVLTAGLFFAVPCFLHDAPLIRGLMVLLMALPFLIALVPSFDPPAISLRSRLRFFFTWLGTREVTRCPPRFDVAALLHLLAALLVFAAAMAAAKTIPAAGLRWLARWFAGGAMILAWAETMTACHKFITAFVGLIAPAVMRSPWLSASLAEFWATRWNPATSVFLHRLLFLPFARRSLAAAFIAPFLGSAVAHMLVYFMATGRWRPTLMWGAFFLAQPVLMAMERLLKVRRWPPAAGHAWTLSALAISSPLFVEPALQVIAPCWGAQDQILAPTAAMLGFVACLTSFQISIWLAVCSDKGLTKEKF